MKHIPNLMTLANAALGLYAIYINDIWGIVLIGIAMLLDVFDGLVARLLDAQSPLGVQLDSMADLISFGVAPAYLCFHYIEMPWAIWVAIFYSLSALYRLARFNTLETTSVFTGLPSPAAAGIVGGYLWWYSHTAPEFSAIVAWSIVGVAAVLMNVPIPFFSLKGSIVREWRIWIVVLGVLAVSMIDLNAAVFVGFSVYALLAIISSSFGGAVQNELT